MVKRINKLIAFIMSIAVIFTAMPWIPARAEDVSTEATAELVVSETEAYAGNYGYITISANAFSQISALEFTVRYDEDVFKEVSCGNGWFADGSTMEINTQEKGVIKVSLLNVDGLTGSGELLYISFGVKNDVEAGSYPISLTIGEAYDTQLNAMDIQKTSGKVKVKESQSGVNNVSFYTTVDNTDVTCGDTFSYTLCAESVSGLSGGNFIFEYDRDVLEVIDVKLGKELCTSQAISSINQSTAGVVKVSYANIDAIVDYYGVNYITLTFKVKDNNQTQTQIKFSANGLTSNTLNHVTANSITNDIRVVEKKELPAKMSLRVVEQTEECVKVDVVLQAGSKVAAGDFAVSYSMEALQCVETITGTAIEESNSAYLITKENISNGNVKFSYVNTNPFEEEAVLLTMMFEPRDGFSGDTNLEIQGSGVVDSIFQQIEVQYEPVCFYVEQIVYTDINEVGFKIGSYSSTYDGKEKRPTVSNSQGLVEGQDYKVRYVNNVKAGTASIYIDGIGRYVGTKRMNFTIKKLSIINISGNLASTSYEYTGASIKPEVKLGNLKKDVDYTVAYKNNIKLGTATVTVTGKGSCTGSREFTFKINRANIGKKQIHLSYTICTYNGLSRKPTVTISGLKSGTDFKVVYSNNLNAGTAKVQITGLGNYTGTVTKTFVIKKADISKKIVTLSVTKYTYSGFLKKPTAKISGLKLNTHFKVTYKNNKYVGTATATITGTGNYTGSTKKTFVINPKSTSISSLIASKKALTVKWKKMSTQTTGYEVQYSTSSSFKNAKIKRITKYTTTSQRLSGLSAKKRYYVRVRTYKKVNGVTYYSVWSSKKSLTTK